ncbi:hypothetical protein [Mesobacillus thioparans]|uniref:hypothetical protein n=1 Tax=Mesobacillus thioparans TaxID=370439 RepID=UPI0039EFFD97
MKENLQRFTIIGALLILAGGILTFKSVSFGISSADSWLADRGGADTGYYHIIVKSYINSFLVGGGIMLGLGLVLTSLAAYKLLKIGES